MKRIKKEVLYIKNKNIEYHIHDIDEIRIQFYRNMREEEERQKKCCGVTTKPLNI